MGKCLRLNPSLWKFLVLGALLICVVNPAVAAPKQMENLSRGLVASNVGKGMLVSFRLLGTDESNTEFNLYRDGTKIATIKGTEGTNYLDASGNSSSNYSVAAVIDGKEGAKSGLSLVLDKTISNSGNSFPYKTIKMDVPKSQTMPDGEVCTYVPNDASAADLDGDGEYEIILKWDPSNAHDNSQTGYTGTVFIDAYKLNGTRLWRIDLGKNIRAGAHYTQFQVFDYDGDGKAEMIVKTADGTIDGTGKVIGNASIDNRDGSGLILKGNEFLTVFRGSDGAEITTIDYVPKRDINQSVKGKNGKGYWGDNYGNRSERYIAATAYLDGVHPSAIFIRGYYSASYVVAYDFDGKTLKQRWYHKSEDPGQGLYEQGNHNITVGDIDDDGYDEIVFGAAALNHDGTLRYRTGFGHGDAGHLGDLDPDRPGLEFFGVQEHKDVPYTDNLRDKDGKVIWGTAQPNPGVDNGRGIAADIDPNHRGYEMWSSKGGGLKNVKGETLGTPALSQNFRIYFDGDVYDELLDGAYVTKYDANAKKANVYFDGPTALKANGCNGTKNTPTLVADLFGDWREELVVSKDGDPSTLYIISTPVTSPHRVYTLMHDAVYRTAIAWQNTAYNQPPHLGYYLPDAVKNLKKPDIYVVGEGASSVVDNPITPKDSSLLLDDELSLLDASTPKVGIGVFESTNVGFIDNGYYNFENSDSSYGVWEIFSPKSVKTTLKIRFANGGTVSRDMQLTMNDNSVGTVNFQAGSWTTYEESSIEVSLNAGVNKLKLSSLSSEGGPNVDMFTFATKGIEIYDGTQKVPEELPNGVKTNVYASMVSSNVYNIQTGLLRTNRAGMAEVYVFNANGNLIGSTYKNVPAGISVLDFNHDLLSKGVYMVVVKLNGKVVSKQKFLK